MTSFSTKALEDDVHAAAVHVFELGKAGPDGVTVAAKAEHILATTGRAPSILDGPEMPEEAQRAWGWFLDLHTARPSGYGLSPIAWSDLLAYLSLSGIQATAWELRLLRTIDRAFLEVNAPPLPSKD